MRSIERLGFIFWFYRNLVLKMQSIAQFQGYTVRACDMNILRLKILLCILSIFYIHSGCQAQTKSWAERMAESIINVHSDSLVVRPYVTHGPSEEKIELKQYNRSSAWNYEHAVLLKGFECLGQETGNPVYLNYIKKMIDVLVQP